MIGGIRPRLRNVWKRIGSGVSNRQSQAGISSCGMVFGSPNIAFPRNAVSVGSSSVVHIRSTYAMNLG
jgi:hypothetical protein